MLLGYARVSTDDQAAQLQLDASSAAGCKQIFSETVLGRANSRPVLGELLSSVRKGDTVIVSRLDRLRRSLRRRIEIIQRLKAEEVDLRSLTGDIETTNANGHVFFHIFEVMAEYKRELALERAQDVLAAANVLGRKSCWPRKLGPNRMQMVLRLLSDPETTVSGVAKELGVHLSTRHKALQGALPFVLGGKPDRHKVAEATL